MNDAITCTMATAIEKRWISGELYEFSSDETCNEPPLVMKYYEADNRSIHGDVDDKIGSESWGKIGQNYNFWAFYL